MKKVVDLMQYKLEKEKINEKHNNTELFKTLITKHVKDMSEDELEIYETIKIQYIFIYKEMFRVISAMFRDNIYLINNLGDGTFEYIGELSDILDVYILNK